MNKTIQKIYENYDLMILRPDFENLGYKVYPGISDLDVIPRIFPNPIDINEDVYQLARMMTIMRGIKDIDLNSDKGFDLVSLAINNGVNPTILESLSFTFEIHNVSLASTHQLVRHRLAGFSQMSTRAMNIKDIGYRIPQKIYDDEGLRKDFLDQIYKCRKMYLRFLEKGISYQSARYIIPQALATSIWMTANYRVWQMFVSQRLCYNVMWETRFIAEQIKMHITKWNKMFGDGLRKPCEIYDKCGYNHNMMKPCKAEDCDEDIEYIFENE